MSSKNNKDVYIGSVSPTITAVQQRKFLKVCKKLAPLLTVKEWMEVMNIFDRAIDRVFKENKVEEKDETEIIE